MRKSQAPSFKQIPVGSNTNKNELTTKTIPIGQNVRSTESVLQLLNTERKEESAVECLPKCANSDTENIKLFAIVYGKQTKKKHKTWEGDGTLSLNGNILTAKDEADKIIGTVRLSKCKDFGEGCRFFCGNKEVEVIEEIVSKRKRNEISADVPVTVKRSKPTFSVPNNPFKSLNKGRLDALNAKDGFVLPEPTAEHQWNFSEGRPACAVTVDNYLAHKLRPHQRKGVIFLYECLMGFRSTSINGAILADDMGLGKTLQCITLIWTLLRQGPYGKAAVRRVLIVTPSSLTGNWANEFQKWLGRERISPFVIGAKNRPENRHVNDRVVIVSYEMLMRHRAAIGDEFDLLICDEAHRLKNTETKVSQALQELCPSMRILLTGTPIQNDLQEFYALVNFANPNSLGSASQFKRQYEDPIVQSKQPECSEEVRLLGEERTAELNQLTGQFVLRRTRACLDDYLPSKRESVVVCRPSPLQRSVYNSVLSSLENICTGLDGAAHLGVISSLRKVASHPALLWGDDPDSNSEESSLSQKPNDLEHVDITLPEHSGKLKVVIHLLASLWAISPPQRERIVLVSSFTQTLDMLEQVCRCMDYPVCRLDGSTPSAQRMDIVNRFNSNPAAFVFLLSSKAGGVGLNLTGASRLLLFDSDWNPATDMQAMARIWRDGQKRNVFIYRLLTADTIEEVMFGRQVKKVSLAGGIVEAASSSAVQLSKEQLDIFLPCDPSDDCWTHSMLGCACNGDSIEPPISTPSANAERGCQLNIPTTGPIGCRIEELMDWEHHKSPFPSSLLNDLKLSDAEATITFIFSTSC